MAKVLNLKLFYKGKLVNFATQGKEIKSRFVIGSSKYMFWQILDSTFPDKYELIKKSGDEYVLKLNSKMQFAYDTAGGQEKASGNEIVLVKNKTGKLTIGTDWAVTYQYNDAYVQVLTADEQKIVQQYARRAELDSNEKFTRGFLIAATIVALGGALLFEAIQPKEAATDGSLSERMRQLEQMAQKVELKNSANQFDAVEEAGKAEKKEEAKVVTKTTTGTNTGVTGGKMSKAEAKSALQNLFGSSTGTAGATGTSSVTVMAAAEDIIASSFGSGSGGSGGGGNRKGPRTGGSGGGTVFDPSAVTSVGTAVGLSSGKAGKGLSTVNPGGDIRGVVGDIGRLAPLGRASTRVSAGVLSTFNAPGVNRVKENNLAAAPAEQRPELQRIEQKVARYKPQLKELFNRQSQIKAMYGTVKFALYIGSDGSVKDAEAIPMSGEVYTEFLNGARQLMLGWKFDNTNKITYEFSMTFLK